ncbi:MAG TPA: adenylate/guanylate cyclase domain-containing protein [Desulfuromonadaceae bacterium]
METDIIRLLIVDDDSFVRDLLSDILRSYGYAVETAADGQEGFDRYIADQDFSLIVSDMEMPVMSGLEMTKRLRVSGFDVPILILTANVDISIAIEAMKNGACDYILKGEDIQESIVLAVANVLEKQRLKEQNRTLEHMVAERTKELNASLLKVEAANRLIRQTFGRYLSDDVVSDILSSPERASLGGETRLITIMMTDLRGFTAISERLPAADVLAIINIYLEKMTTIIMKYQGTIIEFIGDAILAVFGAPVLREDDAKRAVACAVEMQQAMADVNACCRELGYPEIEQGIGLNTGESVVGNIGSDKRTKYGIVGRHVNLTGRIESYTVGGQILVSECTAKACGSILSIHDTLEVMPKGVNQPITLFEVTGIAGDFNVSLPHKKPAELVMLQEEVPIGFYILEGKHATGTIYNGRIRRLGAKEALIHSEMSVERMTNLKVTIPGCGGNDPGGDLYAKVIESSSCSPSEFKVHFTSLPPDAKLFLENTLNKNPEFQV